MKFEMTYSIGLNKPKKVYFNAKSLEHAEMIALDKIFGAYSECDSFRSELVTLDDLREEFPEFDDKTLQDLYFDTIEENSSYELKVVDK